MLPILFNYPHTHTQMKMKMKVKQKKVNEEKNIIE